MSNFIKENNIFLQQIGKKKKEPLNKLLCFYILSQLNGGVSDLKCFIQRPIKDLVNRVYEVYKTDSIEDQKDYELDGLTTDFKDLEFKIRVELYKLDDRKCVKRFDNKGGLITYQLTDVGQKFVKGYLLSWFLFKSNRAVIEGVVYDNYS